jgi:hypothetical protein
MTKIQMFKTKPGMPPVRLSDNHRTPSPSMGEGKGGGGKDA